MMAEARQRSNPVLLCDVPHSLIFVVLDDAEARIIQQKLLQEWMVIKDWVVPEKVIARLCVIKLSLIHDLQLRGLRRLFRHLPQLVEGHSREGRDQPHHQSRIVLGNHLSL